MRLCVVVPTLDEASSLPRLLRRLAGSGADAADEVVVSDGGSRDGTAELARRSGARVIVGAPCRGAQLAAGARASTAELVLFLHADSVPEPGALAAVRRAFEDERVVATGMRQRIPADGFVYRAIERAADVRVRHFGLVYGDSALAVRREVYAAVGGFKDLPLFEDVDLSRRLRVRGRIRLVEDAIVRISSRRWKRDGALWCTLRNWILTAAYLMGVDPRRLARHYGTHGASEQ